MRNKRQARFGGQIIIGIFVALLGAVFTLHNLDLIDGWLYLRLWPLVIVALGAGMALQADNGGGRFWGGAVALIGLLILFKNLDWIGFGVWDLWPVILILIGASVILHSFRGRRQRMLKQTGENDDTLSAVAVLSGFRRAVVSREFRGGEITAVMGGAEIDLRGASMSRGREASIEIFAFWGGVELQAPREWSVKVVGTPILGGYEDNTFQPQEPDAPRLFIRGTVIMGGVEITN